MYKNLSWLKKTINVDGALRKLTGYYYVMIIQNENSIAEKMCMVFKIKPMII